MDRPSEALQLEADTLQNDFDQLLLDETVGDIDAVSYETLNDIANQLLQQSAICSHSSHSLNMKKGTLVDVTVLLNSVAMSILRNADVDRDGLRICLSLLRQAEAISSNKNIIKLKIERARLQAITFNNLGCYYTNVGQFPIAVQYIRKVLILERRYGNHCDNPAGTQLNLCAVLSRMGRHREAAQCAIQAIKILEECHHRENSPMNTNLEQNCKMADEMLNSIDIAETERVNDDVPKAATPGGMVDRLSKTLSSSNLAIHPQRKCSSEGSSRNVSVLSMSYYNLGVEYEYLKQFRKAVRAYSMAYDVAEHFLGEKHPMTIGICSALTEAKSTLDLELE